jgi:hypothetical protein
VKATVTDKKVAMLRTVLRLSAAQTSGKYFIALRL